MLYYVAGDIFESSAQTIVNPVNTVGVMGAGLARAYKERYPKMFAKYKYACEKGFSTGNLLLSKEDDHWVLCFPTKSNWKNKSNLKYIEDGLRTFRNEYENQGITSAAFPMLGCGLGGLVWQQVKPLLEQYLGDLPIDILIYTGKMEDNESKDNEKPKSDSQGKSETVHAD